MISPLRSASKEAWVSGTVVIELLLRVAAIGHNLPPRGAHTSLESLFRVLLKAAIARPKRSPGYRGRDPLEDVPAHLLHRSPPDSGCRGARRYRNDTADRRHRRGGEVPSGVARP